MLEPPPKRRATYEEPELVEPELVEPVVVEPQVEFDSCSCSSKSSEEVWYSDHLNRMRLKPPRRPAPWSLMRIRSPRSSGVERWKMLQEDKDPWAAYQSAE